MSFEPWAGNITITLPTVTVAIVLFVSVRYWGLWTRSDKRTWRGLLPLHVGLVTLAHVLLLYVAAYRVRHLYETAYGTGQWWTMFGLTTAAELVTIVAMGVILGVGRSGHARATSGHARPDGG